MAPLILALTASLAVATVAITSAPTAQGAETTTSPLPFDMPSTATLQASSKKAYAHYVPTLPISMDNQDAANDYYQRNYLNPDGESGRHKAYGGWLRDRPLPRAPLAGDWRMEDLKTSVRQAISAGLDGFTLVIYSMPTSSTDPSAASWQSAVNLMVAAHEVDPNFEIIPMPDISGELVSRSVDNMAMNMAKLASYPSAKRLPDGRVVISPYSAELHPASWWSGFNDLMRSKYGHQVALVPLVFDETANRPAFAPISYGITTWGSRSPNGNNPDETGPESPVGRIAEVHKINKIWMQAVSTEESRPRSSIYEEAANTTNLRNTWQIAIKGGADWVQLATWSDFPENSQMSPTVSHGWSLLDISAYYATWFKTGTAPRIVRDTVYLTNRKHPVAARPTYPQTELMKLIGNNAAQDTVEALTFLTAPATVEIQVGTNLYRCAAKAGVDTCTVPLGTGAVSTRVLRDGAMTAGVVAKSSVTNQPYVQDMKYQAVNSGRDPMPAGYNPGPATAPNIVRRIVTTMPNADTYADANAPSVSYSTSSQMVSRGTPAAVSYLRFPVPTPPPGTTLESARLLVRTSTAAGAGSVDPHRLSLVDQAWSEGTVTWKNRPALGAQLGTLAANTLANSAYSVPLNVSAVAPLAGSNLSMGVSSTGSDNVTLWSTGHASTGQHPRLELTYVPTEWAPSPTPSASPTSTPTPTPTATPTASPSPGEVVTLLPVADTYADRNAPTTGFGGSSQMFARSEPAASAYMKFDLPAAPAGATLTGAKLSVQTTTATDSGSTGNFDLTLASNDWADATVTWNNRPALTSTALGTLRGPSVNTAYTTTLDPAGLRSASAHTITLAVSSTTSTDNIRFWSTGHQSPSVHPRLILTYS